MLDKKRSHGLCYGGQMNGMLTQDGKYFTPDGFEIDEHKNVIEPSEPNGYLDKGEIMKTLDSLGVEYDKRLGRDKLLALLESQ